MGNRYQVAIVGGGPVGMALAVNLALRGISCTVVEQHLEPQRIPKGQNLLQRSVEHFWFWGLADELRASRIMPRDYPMSGLVAYGSLTSDYWYAPPQRELLNPYYFLENERLPQYRMEAVLRRKAASLPNLETRFGWSAISVEQDENSVRVAITREQDGAHDVVEAEYAVGCDGANSMVREKTGITRSGTAFDQLMVLAVFRSRALNDALNERFPPLSTYRVMHQDLKGYWQFFGRIDVEEGWFFHAPVPATTTRENFDFQGFMEKIAGFPFACEFDHVGFWDMHVAVADTYQVGRVFIAGDAAHSHPPYGGYGLNNGLEDAVNLGWKLAAKLKGWGGDALLQSYGEERHPIFRETGDDFIAARIEGDRDFFDRYNPDRDKAEFEQAWENHADTAGPRMLSYEPNYEGSSIVAGPPGARCSAHGSHSFVARAGHHLPPQNLSKGSNVYEVLSHDFTLLCFDADTRTIRDFEQSAEKLSVPLRIVRDTAADGREAYEAKYILVRPDQFVAWRGNEPPRKLAKLMKQVVGSV